MLQTARARWMKWSELPWMSKPDALGASFQLCERLLQKSLDLPSVKIFLHEQLPEIATEMAVQWAAVVRRTPKWKVVEECGDRKSTRLNSSHANISYAVFCLKKKKNNLRA